MTSYRYPPLSYREVEVDVDGRRGTQVHVGRYTYGDRRYSRNGARPDRLRPKLFPCRCPEGDVGRFDQLFLVEGNAIAVVPKRDAEGVQFRDEDVARHARRFVAASKYRQRPGGFRREEKGKESGQNDPHDHGCILIRRLHQSEK